MPRPWAATLAVVLFFAPTYSEATSADVPFSIFVDGVRADAGRASVVEHRGYAYIEAVRAVRIFGGLLRFANRGKVVRVTIAMRTMNFVVGQKTAYLEGLKIVLPAPPQRFENDVYLPLVTIAKLASARVVVDRTRRIASIHTDSGDAFPPAPGAAQQPADSDDDEASPVQALWIQTSAIVDASGLHAIATIRNTTANAYTLSFPSQKQVAFVLSRDGTEVWDSSAAERGTAASSLDFAPHETKTVSATDADFAQLGPGRYLLRVRLQTLIPLDTPPISIGDVTPNPGSSH
jgi:hypothetical protein